MIKFFMDLSLSKDGGPLTVLRRVRLPVQWENLTPKKAIEKFMKLLSYTSAKLPSLEAAGQPVRSDVGEAVDLRRRGAPRDPEITRALELLSQGTTFREICRALGKRTSSDKRNLGQAMRMRAWRARTVTKSKKIRAPN